MWSPPSTEAAHAARASGCALRVLPAVLLLVLAVGCAHTPRSPAAGPPAAGASGSAPAANGAPAAVSTPGQHAPPPARAVADFQRAVGLMRAGNVTEAELEFQQIAVSYPQLCAPEVNLGILYRKSDRLDLSEKALREAVARDGANPSAWDELGVTLRMQGRFKEAADAYRSAIAADGSYAPAYRNLGVLLDLYLGDPGGALAAFERYKELSGEQKPVSGWIAELRPRAGKTAPAPAATAPAATAPAATPPAGRPGSAPQAGQGPAQDKAPASPGKSSAASPAAPQRAGE